MGKSRSKNIAVVTLEATPKISTNHVHQALSALIEVSRLGQVSARRDYPNYDIGNWVRNWCTIRVGTSRGAGHTQAMAKTIIDNDWHAIVFVPNHQMVGVASDACLNYATKQNILCNRTHDRLMSDNFSIRFLTCNDSIHNITRTPNIDAVFIDNASSDRRLDEKPWEASCQYAQSNRDFFFIYLQ